MVRKVFFMVFSRIFTAPVFSRFRGLSIFVRFSWFSCFFRNFVNFDINSWISWTFVISPRIFMDVFLFHKMKGSSQRIMKKICFGYTHQCVFHGISFFHMIGHVCRYNPQQTLGFWIWPWIKPQSRNNLFFMTSSTLAVSHIPSDQSCTGRRCRSWRMQSSERWDGV